MESIQMKPSVTQTTGYVSYKSRSMYRRCFRRLFWYYVLIHSMTVHKRLGLRPAKHQPECLVVGILLLCGLAVLSCSMRLFITANSCPIEVGLLTFPAIFLLFCLLLCCDGEGAKWCRPGRWDLWSLERPFFFLTGPNKEKPASFSQKMLWVWVPDVMFWQQSSR